MECEGDTSESVHFYQHRKPANSLFSILIAHRVKSTDPEEQRHNDRKDYQGFAPPKPERGAASSAAPSGRLGLRKGCGVSRHCCVPFSEIEPATKKRGQDAHPRKRYSFESVGVSENRAKAARTGPKASQSVVSLPQRRPARRQGAAPHLNGGNALPPSNQQTFPFAKVSPYWFRALRNRSRTPWPQRGPDAIRQKDLSDGRVVGETTGGCIAPVGHDSPRFARRYDDEAINPARPRRFRGRFLGIDSKVSQEERVTANPCRWQRGSMGESVSVDVREVAVA